MDATLFEGVDVGAVVAACRTESQKKKPVRSRRGLHEIRAFVEEMQQKKGMSEGELILSTAIAIAIWNTPSRSTIWKKVKSADGLAKALGGLLSEHGMKLRRDKKRRGFIMPKQLPKLNEDGSMAEPAIYTT